MIRLRMVIAKIPVVYPKSWTWALLLFMIGIFGFVAQVSTTSDLHNPTVELLLPGADLRLCTMPAAG